MLVDGSDNEIERIRSIFEEAITNQGLNFAQGASIFEIFREFESVRYSQLQVDFPVSYGK